MTDINWSCRCRIQVLLSTSGHTGRRWRVVCEGDAELTGRYNPIEYWPAANACIYPEELRVLRWSGEQRRNRVREPRGQVTVRERVVEMGG